jgi:tetratricopeptide (TPR) repeat protein
VAGTAGQAARTRQRTELALLAQLAERRHRDPARARAETQRLQRALIDPVVAARAAWVVGLTSHELRASDEAVSSYEQAIQASLVPIDPPGGEADQARIETLVLARASLSVSLLGLGDTDGAVREMALARDLTPPSTRGQVEMLYGLMRQRTGHLTEAQTILRRALRQLTQVDDQYSIARLRLNRGALRAYQGDPSGALEDLAESERIAQARDLPSLAAMAAHNIAFAHGRRGDLPAALAALERAEVAYARLEDAQLGNAVLLADRCDVLLLAGLVDEAVSTARAAVAAVAASGDQSHLNETRLLAARALLAQGQYVEAAGEAQAAADQFDLTQRRPWAAQARYVGIQAEVLASQDDDRPPLDLLGRSRDLALELERQGWPIEAVHARTFVGRLALALGRPAVARRELAAAAAARRRGPAEQRAQAWHAAALLHLADGDPTAARRALVAGLGVIDRYRATLGATELRTGAAGHGSELTRLGTRLALADGRPGPLLGWAERGRARALSRPRVRPPDDAELAADLTALRQVDTELRETIGQVGDPDGPADETVALRRQARALEDAIRHRTRQARDLGADGTTDPDRPTRLDLPRLRRRVGLRVLIEYVELDGELHAITLHRGRLAHHRLGPAVEVEREREYLLFALRRWLAVPSNRSSGARHQRPVNPEPPAVRQSAARLDELLVAPLLASVASAPDGAGIIVVPTGSLYGVAWSALPSLAGRPTTVAPSAAVWMAPALAPTANSASAGSGGKRTALIAGPDLPGARAEVRRLARLYPDAEVLVGRAATVEAVLGAIERAEVVHLAAHGTFRVDSPLFSSVRLADGPLTVYDLERVHQAPRLVVLSACEAATVAVRSGDELLGTAATLIGMGVRDVIAPVTAVPDDATRPLMVALHRELAAGWAPAAALARAAGHEPGLGAATFVCVGGDDEALSAR